MKMTIPLAAACLLASAAPAYAECAWVLWTGHTKDVIGDPTWTFSPDVHETRKACESALGQEIENQVQVWRETYGAKVLRPREGPSDAGTFVRRDMPREIEAFSVDISTESGKKMKWFIRDKFRCLPDTVDPRGPKGR
jgi:hypothetical protein